MAVLAVMWWSNGRVPAFAVIPPSTSVPALPLPPTEIPTLRNPDVRKQLQQIGVDPIGSTPAEFAAYVQKQMTRWAAVVEKNKITAD